MCERWVRDWTKTATYWPPFPPSLAALLSRSDWLLNRGPWRPSSLLDLVLTASNCNNWLQTPDHKFFVSRLAGDSLTANMGDRLFILQMFAVLLLRTQMILLSGKQTMNKSTTPQCRKWPREDNKVALYFYFQCNPAKRGYRKEMIEIWTGFGRFKATNQRLTDQVRTITNNGGFSYLKTLVIHQQIYRQTHQQTPNTVTERLNTGTPETPH